MNTDHSFLSFSCLSLWQSDIHTKGKATQIFFYLKLCLILLNHKADNVSVNNEFICNNTRAKQSTVFLVNINKLVSELTILDL